MTGRDFLFLAKTLHNSDDEAARRSAVSRAYYAIFHQVKDIFVSANIRLNNDAQDHGKLTHYLGACKALDVKYIGEKLKDLRTERNDADYDLGKKKFEKTHCEFQCRLAETLCNKLDSIDRTALDTELVEYARIKGDLKT
jgi:uncharacterized protein (UPF0332 family)